MTEKLIAVIRVRGIAGVRWKVVLLLNEMKLTRRNHLVLLKDSPSARRMLFVAKDYITWGEVNDDTLAKLKAKYGEKKAYGLNPAKKGFGSLKRAFPKGALGNRGEKINDLIERMI